MTYGDDRDLFPAIEDLPAEVRTSNPDGDVIDEPDPDDIVVGQSDNVTEA